MLLNSPSLLGKNPLKSTIKPDFRLSNTNKPNLSSARLSVIRPTFRDKIPDWMGGRTPLSLNHSPKIKVKAPVYFSLSYTVTFTCTEMLEGNLGIWDNLWQIFSYEHTKCTGLLQHLSLQQQPWGSSVFCLSWTSQICSGLYREISRRNHAITLTGSQLPSRGKTFQIQAPCVTRHHPSWHK